MYYWTGSESPYPREWKKLEQGTVDGNGWNMVWGHIEKNSNYWKFIEDPNGQTYTYTRCDTYPWQGRYYWKVVTETGYWKWVGDAYLGQLFQST